MKGVIQNKGSVQYDKKEELRVAIVNLRKITSNTSVSKLPFDIARRREGASERSRQVKVFNFDIHFFIDDAVKSREGTEALPHASCRTQLHFRHVFARYSNQPHFLSI